MRLLDANLLLYAVNEDAPAHEAARTWLERTLSGSESVGFTWPVLLAFLRLSTRVAVFPKPLTVEQAVAVVDSWLGQACAVVVEPSARHWAILRDLLAESGSGGNLASDAHLAAIAIGHGAELCSMDHDFGRFRALRWVNPLVADS